MKKFLIGSIAIGALVFSPALASAQAAEARQDGREGKQEAREDKREGKQEGREGAREGRAEGRAGRRGAR